MAQVTEVKLIDDLDGGKADESVVFAIDHKEYMIDLSAQNVEKLREVLAPFLAKARKAGSAMRSAVRTSSTQPSYRVPGHAAETAKVREWAKDQGHKVSERGRIASHILEAYANRLIGNAKAAETRQATATAKAAKADADATAERLEAITTTTAAEASSVGSPFEPEVVQANVVEAKKTASTSKNTTTRAKATARPVTAVTSATAELDTSKPTDTMVRAWRQSKSLPVSPRGKVSGPHRLEYLKAHGHEAS